MISIANININIRTSSTVSNEILDTKDSVVVRDELINMLRIISKDERLKHETLVIPEACEQYGFSEGNYRLPELLHFLADMLE